MTPLDEPALVIIGSGAGGGTLAAALTAAGKRVVLLEAGPRIEPSEWHQDDLAAYGQLSWLDPRVATGDWAAATFAPERPAWTVKAVGGTTLHWNGIALRAQPHELAARTVYGDIKGASLADWPITLDELAPWYAKAEAQLGVSGSGNLPLHPPTAHYKVLAAGAKAIGYTRVGNGRLAINVDEYDDRPGCQQLGFCNQGCKVSAKWSTLVAEIPRAEATGRLDLRTPAMAVRIEHDAAGLANAVIYRDAQGRLQRQQARTVVVAANAIETARLLLLSSSSRFPDGLGNGSGHVGRHYMRHVSHLTYAAFDRPVHMQRGITTPGVVYDEARLDPTRGFAGGYLMQAASMAPVSLALLLDPGGWGADYSGFIGRYDHLAGMLMNGEELPRPDNRVTLSATTKDNAAQVVASVHVDEHPETHVMRAHFRRQSAALYTAIGGRDVRHGQPVSAMHNMGTCRMSKSPKDGVVDQFGRCHEVSNLWIADGSVFPTSTAENPTLTIVALARRLAATLLAG